MTGSIIGIAGLWIIATNLNSLEGFIGGLFLTGLGIAITCNQREDKIEQINGTTNNNHD